MKKYLVIIMAACCLLSGCAVSGQAPAPSEAPAVTEAPQPAAETAAVTPSGVTVSPLPATIEMADLNSCTVAVSINEGDIYADDTGTMQIKFTVYNYDLYDMVDIAALKEGDCINILGSEVLVSSLSRKDNGDVIINGGLDMGGHELRTDESGVFYETGYNDAKSWYPIGEAVFKVSPDFVFTDSSDLDNPPVTYSAGDFLTGDSGILYHFVPGNTKLVIEGGSIIAMDRVYIP